MTILQTCRRLRSGLLGAAVLASATVAASPALAGVTLPLGEGGEQTLSVGFGIRTSLTYDSRGAPDGDDGFDGTVDNVRIYLRGTVSDRIAATFNTDYLDATGEVKVLDAYAEFNLGDHFNVWGGKLLPPSDRSNLDGPFFLSSYSFPGLVSRYPAKFQGRDLGATAWGAFADRRLAYAVGVFRGHNRRAGASNDGANPLIAGRVAYHFWEVEKNPGYYTSSTYYGDADVLTVAFVGMYQKNGVGTATDAGNFTGWNVDALMEKKVGDGGEVTLEGAYYQYRTQGRVDVTPGFNGAGPTDNVGGIVAGDAILASAGFMFPEKVGIGRLQPVARFQQFDLHDAPGRFRQYDASLNYIIRGHNGRVSLQYSRLTSTIAPDSHRGTLGLQFQF